MGYVTRYPTEADEPWPQYDVEKCEDSEDDQPVDGIKLKVRDTLHIYELR